LSETLGTCFFLGIFLQNIPTASNQGGHDFFTHREIIRDHNTKIFRCEDFIYDKKILIYEICNSFNIQLAKENLDSIAAAYEAVPEVERPNDHMRQAHPGNYLRKLKPNPITALNSVLSEYMSMFGYDAQ
jgi:hypothetical protein